MWVKVAGVNLVTKNGYDAYKITVAVKSDNPSAVVKEIFSTGVGLAMTAITTVGIRKTLGNVRKIGPVIAGVGAPIVGIAAGAISSYHAGKIWDNTLENTAPGQWSVNQMTERFSIGLRITEGSSTVPVIDNLPPPIKYRIQYWYLTPPTIKKNSSSIPAPGPLLTPMC